MQITIHRGTHEIGGNCVELAAGSTRIVVDVGMPLIDLGGQPFDAKSIRRRSCEDLLANGTLPNVPGMFDGRPPPDAILLSHAHADHTGFVERTRPTIPVYLSRGTSKMLLAGGIFAGLPGVDRDRQRVFQRELPFRIGDFRITAFAVDHSAFDSMAFIIEAEGKRLLYSGDLRVHGRKPGMAERLIENATAEPIDLMFMEGTHFSAGRERGNSEQQLEQQMAEHVQSAPSLVLASFSPLHVDRLVTVYKASRQCGRTLVVDPYTAFVMHLVSAQARISAPTREAGIRVYLNKHFEQSYERRRITKIRNLFTDNQITLAEIQSAPSRYVMVFRPSMTDLDFGGNLPERACCLYSFWHGYLSRLEWLELRSSLEDSTGELIEAHTSGHIFAPDLVEFVRAIGPRAIVPIHTFEPDQFRNFFENTVVLSDGQSFEID